MAGNWLRWWRHAAAAVAEGFCPQCGGLLNDAGECFGCEIACRWTLGEPDPEDVTWTRLFDPVTGTRLVADP